MGKKVRCKRCNKVMRVPDGRLGSGVHATPTVAPELQVQGSRSCPGCGKSCPPTVVVCIQCGVNVETGAMLYASLEEQTSPVYQAEQEKKKNKQEGFFARLLRSLGLKK